jgi:hypothetical protein
MWFFNRNDIFKVSEALDVAEDVTGNYYKFSLKQWNRHKYDVKTSNSLRKQEISKHAFALLNKGIMNSDEYDSWSKKQDFYFICLQDRPILEALNRDKELELLPLLIYILTHELVHIVRFCNFFQRFEVTGRKREREEGIVHRISYEILRDLMVPRLGYVLDVYKDHRLFDMAFMSHS